MKQMERQRVWGIWALFAFFLLACACPNPLARNAEPTPNPAFAGVQLGEVVTAGAIGEGNAPQDIRNTFSTGDPIIFVVAQAASVDAGTTVFARWSRDGTPLEDTAPLTADRLYTDTYIEFHIEPANGTQFQAGEYSVQIYVNGNPGPSTTFSVR